MSPSVSIGVPVRNGARYLERALESIRLQTHADFEVIISDNASTDRSGEICQAYTRRDERFRYTRQAENIGGSANFGWVFQRASGKYFKWAAHDDELEPRYLERCVSALEASPDAVACQSVLRYIDENGTEIGTYDSALVGTGSADPAVRFAATVLLPHDCYEVMGVFPRESLVGSLLVGPFHGCDRALVAELSLRGRFVKVDQPLLRIRDHAERYTRSMYRPKERLAWHAPGSATRFSMPNWRLYREYLGMVRRNVPDRRQRLRCYLVLARWWGHNWNFVRMAIDPIAIAFPGVVLAADRLKQRWISPAPGAGRASGRSGAIGDGR